MRCLHNPRTGASITVVTNATNNVDADAGSIRYVPTVIVAAVLTPRANISLMTVQGKSPPRFSNRYCGQGLDEKSARFATLTEAVPRAVISLIVRNGMRDDTPKAVPVDSLPS